MAASLRQGAVQPLELPMIGIVRHETSRLHMAWFPARAVLILGKLVGGWGTGNVPAKPLLNCSTKVR